MPTVTVKAPPLGQGTAREPSAEFEIGRLNLQGPKGTKVQLELAASAIALESTIEGASTLTVKLRDYDRSVLRSEPITNMPANLTMDGVEYSLAKVARSGNELTLTFEDLSVNILRRYNTPLKADRATTTRAQFIARMIKEPKERELFLFAPEMGVRQPIAPPAKM